MPKLGYPIRLYSTEVTVAVQRQGPYSLGRSAAHQAVAAEAAAEVLQLPHQSTIGPLGSVLTDLRERTCSCRHICMYR